MKDLLVVKIGDSFKKLQQNTLDFRWAKNIIPLCMKDACKVMVHIFEDKEGGSPVKVSSAGSAEENFL